MVEQFNRSLLQLLRTYVDRENDWEHAALPLVLYAYCTAIHASTVCSPFLLMFGQNPSTSHLGPQTAFDSTACPDHIRDKIVELVDTNLAQAASNQKVAYDYKHIHCWRPCMASNTHSWQIGFSVGGKLGFRIHQESYNHGNCRWEQNKGCSYKWIKSSSPAIASFHGTLYHFSLMIHLCTYRKTCPQQ